jgi:ABC-2 type transport system permease protein
VLLSFLLFVFTVNVYLQGSSVSLQLSRAPLVVHDADRSVASRELIYRFRQPYFRLDGEIADPRETARRLDRGEAMVALDIPTGFQESLLRGEPASVQLQVDGTHTVPGFLASSYASRIVGEFGLETARAREGLSTGGPEDVPIVVADQRSLYNPNQSDTWFVPISELLEAITLFSILLPAAAMVREKERGTIEQLLVSPLSPVQIVLPKIVAMTAVILACMTLSLVVILGFIFHVPIRGSLPLFYTVTTLYVFANAGLGLFVATVARTLAQVGLLSLLILAPMILLSGSWTPPEAMPACLRAGTLASPMRHYIEATFAILLKGAGVEVLWDTFLWMAAIGGSIFTFGIWRFRRQFG